MSPPSCSGCFSILFCSTDRLVITFSITVCSSSGGGWYGEQHLVRGISWVLMSTQQWTQTIARGSNTRSAKWLGRACVSFLYRGSDASVPTLCHVPGSWSIQCGWLPQCCSSCCCYWISFFTRYNLLPFRALCWSGKRRRDCFPHLFSSLCMNGRAVKLYSLTLRVCMPWRVTWWSTSCPPPSISCSGC